jgi:hypothetical protein
MLDQPARRNVKSTEKDILDEFVRLAQSTTVEARDGLWRRVCEALHAPDNYWNPVTIDAWLTRNSTRIPFPTWLASPPRPIRGGLKKSQEF